MSSPARLRPDLLVFRAGTEGDAEAITALVNSAYRVEDFFKFGDRTTVEEVLQELREDHFIVAEAPGGTLAGSVHVRIRPPRGYFGMLSVDPAAQGTGLGRALIDRAERMCREAGCDVMDLWVVNLREELIPWYRQLGYTETGSEPWPDNEPTKLPCHFITMSRPLTIGGERSTS